MNAERTGGRPAGTPVADSAALSSARSVREIADSIHGKPRMAPQPLSILRRDGL